MILTPFFELKFMLKEESLKRLQSEKFVSVPSLNSLMKISLGLIFFTILSTALVYAEVFSTDSVSKDSDLTFNILDNAHLKNSISYLDKTMVSVNPGDSIIIVNNDVVSHSFVSGVSNTNNEGKINYDDFLICELDEKISPGTSGYTDDNLCDFNKDNRISISVISPGDSKSFSVDEIGTYRLIDTDYPWIEILVYSFPKSEAVDNDSQTIDVSPPVISIEPISIETGFVTIDNNSHSFPYTTKGMTVTEIEADLESVSLIFSVNVDDSTGKLDVTFDRFFFDSIYDGVDDRFFVLADGDETFYIETETTSISRSLTIDVPFGTEELEIIGSEFVMSEEIIIPVVETPVVETIPTNECGPGTVLENNVCVLDSSESSSSESSSTSSSKSSSNKEMITSFSIAFAIAGVIGIILALIAKAHKKKN